MSPLSLNSLHSLHFSPHQHLLTMPTKTQSQRKASLAGRSCGNSGLRGTTQLLMSGILLEHPSSAQPSVYSGARTVREAQVTLFFEWLSTYAAQPVSPQKTSTFSIFFSFGRFECTWLNRLLGRRQLLGYLPRQLQRVGGDGRDTEPLTPSLDQEWDRIENSMAIIIHLPREIRSFRGLQIGATAFPPFWK